MMALMECTSVGIKPMARYSNHCLETYLYHHTHHITFSLPIPDCRRVLLKGIHEDVQEFCKQCEKRHL